MPLLLCIHLVWFANLYHTLVCLLFQLIMLAIISSSPVNATVIASLLPPFFLYYILYGGRSHDNLEPYKWLCVKITLNCLSWHGNRSIDKKMSSCTGASGTLAGQMWLRGYAIHQFWMLRVCIVGLRDNHKKCVLLFLYFHRITRIDLVYMRKSLVFFEENI